MYRDEFYDYVELSANQIILGFIIEALAYIGVAVAGAGFVLWIWG